MDSIVLESSSEDDDDIYSNSVARLKAFKEQVVTDLREKEARSTKEIQPFSSISVVASVEPVDAVEIVELTGPVTRRQTRPRARRNKPNARIAARNECNSVIDLDSDLEIISIQEVADDVTITKIDLCGEAERDTRRSDPANATSTINDDNYEMDVRILWRSKSVHRLNIQRNETFRKIFQHFADLENVSIEQILISKKDKPINITDTPATVDLSIIDILEGGVVHANDVCRRADSNKVDEDTCSIKIQMENNKQSWIVPLKKDEKFEVLFARCAEHLEMNKSSIKLYFDGDQLDPTDTPESLEFEQEACIDLRVSKS